MVTEVKRYQTEDGKEFAYYDRALQWELRCKLVAYILENTGCRDEDAEMVVDCLMNHGVVDLDKVLSMLAIRNPLQKTRNPV